MHGQPNTPDGNIVGHELINAGMLIMDGRGNRLPFDYDELVRWTRVGYERGMRFRKGERERTDVWLTPDRRE